jgi:ATP-binding cassette, subfamily B, bacterial
MPLSSYHSGNLLTRLTSDVDTISHCLVRVLPGKLSLVVRLVAAFLALLHYKPGLAILVVLLRPTAVLFTGIWGRTLSLSIKYLQISS